MLLLQTFTARYFKSMILNGDERSNFAFVEYEKAKTQQELISHQLKLSDLRIFMQFFYVFVQFYKKTF